MTESKGDALLLSCASCNIELLIQAPDAEQLADLAKKCGWWISSNSANTLCPKCSEIALRTIQEAAHGLLDVLFGGKK